MGQLFGIFKKLVHGYVLTEEEKFFIVSLNKVNFGVFDYLSTIFQELEISVLGKAKGNILDLMREGLLIQWCFETANIAILF